MGRGLEDEGRRFLLGAGVVDRPLATSLLVQPAE
jgi:hypothetical protein